MKQLRRYKLTRIVMEATGGYEHRVAEACAAKGLLLIIVQPIKVRQFARAEELMAKTDVIDAQLIAKFGKKREPQLHEKVRIATPWALSVQPMAEWRHHRHSI